MKTVVAHPAGQMRTLSAKLQGLKQSSPEASISMGWVHQVAALDGYCDEIQMGVGKLFKMVKALHGGDASKHLLEVERLFDEVAQFHDSMIAEDWPELDTYAWDLKRRLKAKCRELVPLLRDRRGLSKRGLEGSRRA